MSNYWETNFVKSLAGYYEFNFRLDLGVDNNKNSERIDRVAANVIAFPIKQEDWD